MGDTNEELVIRIHRWKPAALTLPLLPIIAMSVWLHPDDWRNASVWMYLILFGCFILLFVAGYFLRNRYYLRLSPKGLLIQYVGSARYFRWDDIERFDLEWKFIDLLFCGCRILFLLNDQTWSRRLLGHDTAILCVFELNSRELAELLERWRKRYAEPCDIRQNREEGDFLASLPTFPST